MQTLNWKTTEARAKKMDDDQLAFATNDCYEAAAAIGPVAFGKDESYYHDEASVYIQELNRRRLKKGRK